MKMFSKCTVSALAVSAVVVLALLSGGCSKNQENPSADGDPTGNWSAEFYEEELGGQCIVNYSFNEGGTGMFSLVSDMTEMSRLSEEGEDYSFPILWRAYGTDKLSLIPESDKEIYDNLELEWPTVTIKVSGETLQFIYDDEVITFNKTN